MTPCASGNSLHWDVLRLWHEMQRALDDALPELASVGVDTWGVDYALIGENGSLLENPYHYRDSRTNGVMEAGLRKSLPRANLFHHRSPIPAVQHALPTLCRVPRNAEANRRRKRIGHHSRPVQLLAHRQSLLRIHQCHHHADARCANAIVVLGINATSSVCRRDCFSASLSPAPPSAA